MLYTYHAADIVSCLKDRKILFVGDSTVRQIFWALASKLDPRKAEDQGAGGTQHSNLEFMEGRVSLQFIWDPFMNTSETLGLLARQKGLRFGDSVNGMSPQPPALTVLGGGLWYAKLLDLEDATRQYESAIYAALARLKDRSRHWEDNTSVHPRDDLVAIAPVQNVLFSNLKLDKRITFAKVDRMNDLLHDVALRTQSPVVWSLNQLSWQTEEGYIWDGIHNSANIVERKADILLNLRCNSKHMQRAIYPKNRTCCAIYPTPNWVQKVYVKLGLLLLPLIAWMTSKGTSLAIVSSTSLIGPRRCSPDSLATLEENL